MGRWIKNLLARIYRLVTRPPEGEEPVEVESGVTVPAYIMYSGERGEQEAERFLTRLPDLDCAGKSVLDVGCGAGDVCLEMAQRGARRVLGVEISPEHVELGMAKLAVERSSHAAAVELRGYGGDLAELGDERFDIIVSKDSFEHYGAGGPPSAEEMVRDMASHLSDGGLLAIGFGPLWKAPYGGHVDTWLPWAHLIFPEEVIFDEFRRVRPPGKTARTFAEGVGVNKMTLSRFERIMANSGLDQVHVETNVGNNRFLRLMRALRRLPMLRELLTQNVYGVWQRPASA